MLGHLMESVGLSVTDLDALGEEAEGRECHLPAPALQDPQHPRDDDRRPSHEAIELVEMK
jgi:hypothetical protein